MVNRSVRDGREQTHGLSLAGAVGGMARGRSAVNDLHAHLCGMRDGLIAKMAAQLEIGGDVGAWSESAVKPPRGNTKARRDS